MTTPSHSAVNRDEKKPDTLSNKDINDFPQPTLNQDEESNTAFDPPPDGGLHAWLVLLTRMLTAFIGSICTALTLTIGIPVGRWVEVYGHRKVALLGSVVFSGALVAAGFCRTVPTLLVTQGILLGLGAGILFIPASTATVPWFDKKKSISIGISSAGAGVGGIVWSFFARAMIARLGYQWSLRLTACISAFINAVAFCLLKTRPMPSSARHASMWSGLTIFKDVKFTSLYLASGLSVFGYTIPYFYVPTYAQTQLKSSPFVGAILSAVIDLGLTFGRIAMGFACDSRLGTMNTVIGGMTLAGITHLAFWLPSSNSLPLLYIFSFLYGFFGGGYIALQIGLLARIFDPDKLPVITGIFCTSELFGDLAAGPIAGAIFSSTHGKWSPVIIYSGFALICGSFFGWFSRFKVERRILATI
ncbi:hypothetical protein M422DRAFT_238862 [Sphaerobolus stellatus SS14]|nr:hypothetical protein M422DRAFT_238862 [Sphaerobolus stellatus SS14]